jgi:hypothetical protein
MRRGWARLNLEKRRVPHPSLLGVRSLTSLFLVRLTAARTVKPALLPYGRPSEEQAVEREGASTRGGHSE